MPVARHTTGREKTASSRGRKSPPGGLRVLVLSGPNLNLLGKREPGIYGNLTLAEIIARLVAKGKKMGVRVSHFQSNHEGALIDRIQKSGPAVDGILFNPGGYTHTSVALRDALLAVGTPFVEVHLSDPEKREPFRRRSFFTDIAVAQVKGLGPGSYPEALDRLLAHLKTRPK
ncbi:MAG: 3-dehydroquinate dehydratase [Deltaproteobacteria bacterium]|nr:3-dehydroquinate dehydratase [Deltaproteobacteria bacterium]